jgi:hypothetical protein
MEFGASGLNQHIKHCTERPTWMTNLPIPSIPTNIWLLIALFMVLVKPLIFMTSMAAYFTTESLAFVDKLISNDEGTLGPQKNG